MLLINILTNAVTYNDSDSPRMDIRFIIGAKKLHIRFEDNGIGVEKTDTKKIFRKFYQTSRPDGVVSKGSGLGLYLVQNIARMHRGKVIAERRQKEQGSVFTLILPHSSSA
jgi:signal transduction histidine kinase